MSLGCSTSPPVVAPIDNGVVAALTATPVPTVFVAVWDTPSPTRGSVEYGEAGALDHVAVAVDSEDGLHHEATLALAAGYTWSWRPTNDGVPGTGGEVDVAPPPRELPVFTLTIGDGSPTSGFVVGASPVAGTGTAVWILDSWGRYVWWALMRDQTVPATEARLSTDGRWVEWLRGVPGASLHRRTLDGTQDLELPVEGVHHSFVQLPAGGWALLSQRLGEIDGQPIIGEGITELAPDGTTTDRFSSWDEMEVDPSEGTAEDAGQDAIHANGIFYDAAAERYLVSSRSRSSVYAVARADGALEWELGGSHGEFTLESGLPFVEQHGPRIDSNGDLMVFDNGGVDRLASRVAAFSFDEEARTYAQSWQWAPAPSVYSATLGNPDRQPDGGLFVSWGAAGRLEHLDSDGDVDWRADANLGGTVGYAHHVDLLLGSGG